MRMKKQKKGRIKRIYTSLRYRMISISVTVMVFIAVMLAAMLVELHNNQEQYMSMYQKDQQQFIDQLANTLTYMMENGKTEQDVITYMGDEIEASGSRFFVLTKDDSVLFAKNDITTKCLGRTKRHFTRVWNSRM